MMKKYRERKRTGRKKSLRLIALLLCVSLLTTICPYMPGAVEVQAASDHIDHTGHTDHASWTAWNDTSKMPESAGNYYLTVDVDLSGSAWKVPAGDTETNLCNLCLNGHTIKQNTQNRKARVITVPSGATLNLYDEKGNTGNITGGHDSYGGGIKVEDGGKFTMNGGQVTGNTATYGGGIYVESGGTCTMKGGQVTGNTATYNSSDGAGGGICVKGEFTMEGGSISYNTSTRSHGGGMAVRDEGKVYMQGGEITGNTAQEYVSESRTQRRCGGGVYIDGDSEFHMTDGKISNNTAYNSGGGVNVNGIFEMSGGTISGNTAQSENPFEGGGGIGSWGTVILKGGTISGNKASHGAGVLHASSTNLELSGNPVIENNLQYDPNSDTKTNGVADNLYLLSDKKITIASEGLKGNAYIGKAYIGIKSASDSSTITLTETNDKDYSWYFTSDDSRYRIVNKSNVLKLTKDSETDKEKVARAESVIRQLIDGFIVDENTTKEMIQDAIDTALSNAKLDGVTAEVGDLTKPGNNQLTGEITISSGTENAVVPIGKEIVTTHKVNYYLKMPNGSVCEPYESNPLVTKYAEGKGLTLPVPEVVEGYTFYGWYVDESYEGDTYREIGSEEKEDKKYYGYYKDTKVLEETPEIAIDYIHETLTGFKAGESYKITITVDGNPETITEDMSEPLELREEWFGSTVSVVKSGNGTTTTDSGEQEFTVPQRPSAPQDVGTVNASRPGETDGKVTGLTEGVAYEIRVKTDNTNNWGDWEDAVFVGTEITGLPAGEYEVRVKAVEGVGFASKAKAVTVGETSATVEETPEIEIDYRQEILKGFTPNEDYKVTVNGVGDGVPITADENGTVKLKEEWFGTNVSIVKSGNGTTTDSGEQEFTVPQRPSAPQNVGTVKASYPGTADGKLTGLEANKNYQISTDNGAAWTDKTADKNGEITKLAPGSYIVRVSGTASDFAGKPSEAVTIDVGQEAKPGPIPGPMPEPVATPEPTPEITATPEPTPEPTPEVTATPEPTPEPTPEITAAPEPTPETEHKYPEQWTVEKEPTENEPGREYKICETCGTKIYRTIDPLGTPEDPYAGKIEKEVEVVPGAPDTVLNNSKAELAESILTPEEIAKVESGADAKIWLEIAPDVDIAEEEEAQVQKVAEESAGAGAEVTYFDASLFKQVGNGEKTPIHEPGRPISVTIVIPENIRNKDVLMVRNYQIIRLHNGKTDIIKGTYNEESAEFTFETDKFSTYAICYKDLPKQEEPETPTPEPDESGQTGNEIEKRKDLSILLAAGKQKGSAGIRLTWLKWKGASGYEVYWSYCDGKKNYKKLKTVKAKAKRTYTHKKLKKNRAYKYYIAAYKTVDGRKKYVAKSPVIHVAMKYEKRTNAKKITANKTKVILSLTNKKYKKTFKIRVKVKKENRKKKLLSHAAKLRYYTDDKKVAKVSRTGKITAKGRGKCTVYVTANNGVCKKIKVTVK